MSRINLDTQTIQKINYDIQGLDATLTKTYIPSLQASVSTCHANVQNTEIKALLSQIDSQLQTVNGELATNLTNLEEFLSKQVVDYQAASDIALQDINTALSQMEEFAALMGTTVPVAGAQTGNTPATGTDMSGTGATPGDGSTAVPGGADASAGTNATPGAATTTTTTTNEKPGFWEYHGQDFADDWDYSGCDAGLDYIGATVSGLCGTVGSVVNFAVDGVSEFLGWIFG